MKRLSVLLIICFLLLTTPSFAQNKNLEEILKKAKENHFKRIALFEEENKKLTPNKKYVVILGDSLTEGFDLKKHFPDKEYLNRGIVSDTINSSADHRGLLNRYKSSVADCNPSHIFILIGVNDIGDKTELSVLIDEYKKLIAKMKADFPELKIYVCSAFPARGRFAKHNENILKYNEMLKTMVDELHDIRLTYIDLHKHYIDNEGMLKEEWSRDGIHLKAEGYKVWADEIKKMLKPQKDITAILERAKEHHFERLAEFEQENLMLDPVRKHIILLGASGIEGIDEKKLFPGLPVLNRGIVSDVVGVDKENHRGLLKRLDNSVFDCNPSHVFIAIGLNDLGDGIPVEDIIAAYKELLEKIKAGAPEAKLFVRSLLPTRGRYGKHNANIVVFNDQLKALAEEMKVTYVDVYSEFVDSEGQLKEEMSRDGLHLKPGYNRIITNAFKKYME